MELATMVIIFQFSKRKTNAIFQVVTTPVQIHSIFKS